MANMRKLAQRLFAWSILVALILEMGLILVFPFLVIGLIVFMVLWITQP